MRLRRRPTVALVSCLALALALAPVARAAKPGGSGKNAQAAALALASEYTWRNPYDPPWCLSEDDFHLREWVGSLDGTFSATERLCSESADFYNGSWWAGGGIGFQSEVYVVGTLTDLAITSPLGDSHHAVLIGSSTTKGVTTSHYEVCDVPSRSLSSGVGGLALPGGIWTITLSGNVAKAAELVNAEMTDVTYQQEHCPVSEQNLTP
jgi:hypothetical protein